MDKTYEPIATQTLGSAAASVIFSSIPQTFTDLVLVTQVLQVAGSSSLRVRFNGDSGSNYSRTSLDGNGSSALSGRESSITSGYVTLYAPTTTAFAIGICNFQNYSNSTTYKTFISRGGRAGEGDSAIVGLWRDTDAITSIELSLGVTFPSNNLASGSTFTLYGIKAA